MINKNVLKIIKRIHHHTMDMNIQVHQQAQLRWMVRQRTVMVLQVPMVHIHHHTEMELIQAMVLTTQLVPCLVHPVLPTVILVQWCQPIMVVRCHIIIHNWPIHTIFKASFLFLSMVPPVQMVHWPAVPTSITVKRTLTRTGPTGAVAAAAAAANTRNRQPFSRPLSAVHCLT